MRSKSSNTIEDIRPMLEPIAQFTSQHQRFAVVSHARPDGDSIGSALALSMALCKLGKEAVVFQADPVPYAYRRLPGVDQIRFTRRIEGSFDAVFVLECSSLDRTGIEGLEGYFTINIDHHSHAGDYGDLNCNDPSRSAVAELILDLITALEVELDSRIASNLYVAILTDTGSFQFSNTTSRTFAAARQLVETGADPGKLARWVYLSQPLRKVRLLTRVLESLELHPTQQIACISLSLKDFQETGAEPGDTEGLVTHPLSIDGVVMVAFFRQEKPQEYRVSLRSKGHYDVARIARRFGGGGHVNASGFSLKGSLQEVRRRTVKELESLLS